MLLSKSVLYYSELTPPAKDTVTEQGSFMETNTISGRRIVDIMNFFNQITCFPHLEIFSCNNEHLKIVKEIREGFHSKFIVQCMCCMEIKHISSDNEEATTMNINQAVVLGTLSTGGGYAQVREQFGYCNIPVFSKKLYSRAESQLAEAIHEIAWEVLEVAGEKEKEIAIAKGHVDPDGTPFISVIADGAWSKRSYKVNYDAASGVVSIPF